MLLTTAPWTDAATIWNGPVISFSHTDENALQDQLTPSVALTRDSGGGGLFNAVTEGGATAGISPADTEWAIGALADYAALTYAACPLEAGNHPPGYVDTTFVVHLINEDIYFSLTLTDWGGQGGAGDKTFGYIRTTPAVAPPTPAVAFSSPASGAVFAAPANVRLAADASVSSGAVTNVQFFTNGVALRSVLTAPFNLTASNLTVGAYAFTAVATAAGISATSAVVNVAVVSPVAVNLAGARRTGSQFYFNYSANPGLTYVIQSSSNLQNWVPLATNRALVNPVLFSNVMNSAGAKFYRVGRLPNP